MAEFIWNFNNIPIDCLQLDLDTIDSIINKDTFYWVCLAEKLKNTFKPIQKPINGYLLIKIGYINDIKCTLFYNISIDGYMASIKNMNIESLIIGGYHLNVNQYPCKPTHMEAYVKNIKLYSKCNICDQIINTYINRNGKTWCSDCWHYCVIKHASHVISRYVKKASANPYCDYGKRCLLKKYDELESI